MWHFKYYRDILSDILKTGSSAHHLVRKLFQLHSSYIHTFAQETYLIIIPILFVKLDK